MNIDKAHLGNKHVVFKVNSITRTLAATVALVENDGIWFRGGDFYAELAKSDLFAEVVQRAEIRQPVIYVPFSQLNWLLTSDEA